MNELIAILLVGLWGTAVYWLLVAFFQGDDE